ncbi:hypothetical protein SS209_00054 [Salmonella enterica subsp. enterica serovar Senftenberg str. SS209]|nr:hypothetical protein SS209_00054 [Salmonella enterica subsp. enterica serovar Senftenberg str. SS209]
MGLLMPDGKINQ